MQSLTCITCPIGCLLEVSGSTPDKLIVTGNKCPRGEIYAIEEIRAPKRTVTATCRIDGELFSLKRIPVKTVSPCPKDKIPALLCDIYKVKVTLPVKTGDIIIDNWNGEGINIIATRTIG